MASSSDMGRPSANEGSTKASAYARFIPREELSTFAAWNPGELDDIVAGSEEPSVAARFRRHPGPGSGAGAAAASETPDPAELVVRLPPEKSNFCPWNFPAPFRAAAEPAGLR